MSITKSEYLKAKAIVEEYQREKYAKDSIKKSIVQLSPFGREMQKPHNKKGIITDRSLAGMYDYNVEVLWEDGKKQWMHESQTVKITEKGNI